MNLKRPTWFKKNINNELINFLKLYIKRPIKNNIGGMRINHMFSLYFILKKIRPDFVIESGVYRGQSTWLIEKTLPEAKLLSIDPNLNNRIYISKKAKYSIIDFKYQNFEKIPKNTLVFFDDHQSHLDRIMQCKFFKIKHIVLEDNYTANKGDFYSLKHLLRGSGFVHKPGRLSLLKTLYILFKMTIKKIINQDYIINIDILNSRLRDRIVNQNEKRNLKKHIKTYYVLPKIKINKNKKIKSYVIKNYKNEIKSYNYITYLKLN
jgi:hypothetical protein